MSVEKPEYLSEWSSDGDFIDIAWFTCSFVSIGNLNKYYVP